MDAIVRRGDGIPDPDAPSCPESVRFWAFTSGSYTEREKLSVTGNASVSFQPNANAISSLMDLSGAGMPGACGTISPNPSAVSLQSLVGVMSDAGAASDARAPAAKSKAKAKAKARAKTVEPQSLQEKKDAGRTFV